jgi:hypothetical protein
MSKLKVTLEIPDDLESALRTIAHRERRTLSQQISWEISQSCGPVRPADPTTVRKFLIDLETLQWEGVGDGVNSASVFLDYALDDYERILAKMAAAWNYCESEGLSQDSQNEIRAATVRRAHSRFRKQFSRQLASAHSKFRYRPK